MQELWVVLEDEYPALFPAPGDKVELSCRWMPRPTTVPQVLWTPGDSLRSEALDSGTRVFSDFSQLEAVIAPPEDLSAYDLSGVAEVDRYLWIDCDFIPSFSATVVERALITAELGSAESTAVQFTYDTTVPRGRYIVHRLALVQVD